MCTFAKTQLMVLPIRAYGDPVLRVKAKDVSRDEPGLQEFIDKMLATMEGASGVGLAAPQVGVSWRIFIVDTSGFIEPGEKDPEGLGDFREVFINAQMVNRGEEAELFNEGCLSIPDVRGDVERPTTITIRYRNRDWEEKERSFDGLKARVIQHEYDHIEGILFTDHLAPLRKSMVKKRLQNIAQGKIKVAYPMKFPQSKR